jgi:hypothetical protein
LPARPLHAPNASPLIAAVWSFSLRHTTADGGYALARLGGKAGLGSSDGGIVAMMMATVTTAITNAAAVAKRG